MPTHVRLTKPLRSRPPGSTVTIPVGLAQSLSARRPSTTPGGYLDPSAGEHPLPPASAATTATSPYPRPFAEPPGLALVPPARPGYATQQPSACMAWNDRPHVGSRRSLLRSFARSSSVPAR